MPAQVAPPPRTGELLAALLANERGGGAELPAVFGEARTRVPWEESTYYIASYTTLHTTLHIIK